VHSGSGSLPAAQPFPYIGLDPGRGEGVKIIIKLKGLYYLLNIGNLLR